MVCINDKIMSLKISTTDKLVLSALQESAKDSSGITEISNSDIAKTVNLNIYTCKSSLRRLAYAGLIERSVTKVDGILKRKIRIKEELFS